MALMRGKLFAGALFAGMLFGQHAQEAQPQYGGGDEEELRRYTELLTSTLRGRQQASESERIEALASSSSDGLQRDGETTASFGNLGVARQDTLIVAEIKMPIIERIELSEELIANETSDHQRLALLLIAMEV